MKIGILRESKKGESRTPLTPTQAAFLRKELDIDIVVQTSPSRCYHDREYQDAGVPVVSMMEDCDIIMAVKEVPPESLLPGRIYMMFSHTIKMQSRNRPLLVAALEKKVKLIDYELLTNTHGQRLIAFGHFAGVVGAHNAMWTYGKRTGTFELPRMYEIKEYSKAISVYNQTEFPPLKIVLTGTGRVGTGALLTLQDMGIAQVDPAQYLQRNFDVPVFTQLLPHHYAKHKDGDIFDKSIFYNDPGQFESSFLPYAHDSDIMINGIYYVQESPAFFTPEDMQDPRFKIQVIADISCDLAPLGAVPSTFYATTIKDPVYGYIPQSGTVGPPFTPGYIDMMTIDNLPNEIPREASKAFGKQFIKRIMGELIKTEPSDMIEHATIAEDGKLRPAYQYLQKWVDAQ